MDPEVTNAKEEIIMKKILSMILTAIMLVSLAAPALATEIPTDVTVPEGYRLQRGLVVNEKIPYEAVENMEDAAIREMLGGGPLEAYYLQSFSIDEQTGNISRSAITDADFSVGISAQRIYEKGNRYDNFKFMAGCFFLNRDIVSLYKDKLAMSWSDEFTLYDDYAFETVETNFGSGLFVEDYNSKRLARSDVSAEAGLSYSYDLFQKSQPYSIYMVAKVYKLDSAGTAQVTAGYAHAIKNVDISFSVSAPPQISFTSNSSNGFIEAIPNYTFFDY
jgi:hypothetical protein